MQEVLGKIKYVMDKFLAIFCAILLSFMTILVLIQVISRYVFNNPAAFTEELVRYSLIWTGFIGAAYAFSTREHMSLGLIKDKLEGNQKKALMIFIDTLILLIAIFVITIGGYKLALSARMEFSALLGVPRSLVYGIAPVSGVCMIIAQINNLYEDITGKVVSWSPKSKKASKEVNE
ncbi:TRAP transporter small permease [Erysipelotrichaceae bacterium RD49]|nr:TRAP transporter small permease [Erysipelotrichaceae bacterium RD49]